MMGVHWKIQILGRGSWWTVSIFRFWGRIDIPMHTIMLIMMRTSCKTGKSFEVMHIQRYLFHLVVHHHCCLHHYCIDWVVINFKQCFFWIISWPFFMFFSCFLVFRFSWDFLSVFNGVVCFCLILIQVFHSANCVKKI